MTAKEIITEVAYRLTAAATEGKDIVSEAEAIGKHLSEALHQSGAADTVKEANEAAHTIVMDAVRLLNTL